METTNSDGLYSAMRALVMNSLINSYAAERVAFGYEKPGDQAPIDLYLKHLRININDGYRRRDIPGVYIDENERISAKQDYAEYVRDLFVEQMEWIFMDAPNDIRLERDGEEIPLLPRFREYLFGLLPLFTEVLSIEVECSVFDVIPIGGEVRVAGYPKWHELVTAILLKPLRPGRQVNRYVKHFANAPYYISRLIEKKGENFYLKQVDINSYKYIFALFSLMNFMNSENDKIFELKMCEWERLHNIANA